HEGGQDGTDGIHGMTENEPQHPEPDDLVDEPCRTRQKEANEEKPEFHGRVIIAPSKTVVAPPVHASQAPIPTLWISPEWRTVELVPLTQVGILAQTPPN